MKAKSQAALAKRIGCAKSTLTGLLKRDDWPVRRRPPWSDEDVAAIRAWRSNNQDDRSGKASDTSGPSLRQQVDIKLKLERARKAKVDADLAEGKVIPRELADLALLALATAFRRVHDDLRDSLSSELDLTADQTAILQERFDDALGRVSGQETLELDRLDDIARGKLT